MRDRFSRVYDAALAARDTRSTDFRQLDDGGTWYRCRECGAFKRFGTVDGSEDTVKGCVTCDRLTTHVPDRPAYADDGS